MLIAIYLKDLCKLEEGVEILMKPRYSSKLFMHVLVGD